MTTVTTTTMRGVSKFLVPGGRRRRRQDEDETLQFFPLLGVSVDEALDESVVRPFLVQILHLRRDVLQKFRVALPKLFRLHDFLRKTSFVVVVVGGGVTGSSGGVSIIIVIYFGWRRRNIVAETEAVKSKG